MKSTRNEIDRLRGLMHTWTNQAYKAATMNVARLHHPEVGEAHMLLGILGRGNEDVYASIPRVLRSRGMDYTVLYDFLEKSSGLATSDAYKEQEPSKGLQRTLHRAETIARRRRKMPMSSITILTADVVVALLSSRDPLLKRAFEHMGVDQSARQTLRAELSRSFVTSKVSHLQLVTN